ncbi:CTD kinase subunit gamma CTK3-domain-containing protein [Nemania diffusa]|nr:CTD kinase subunit gamma CTK3-domain-containing protein [Nemania diffusa]
MNTRANIMYFIEHLLEMASKERHNDYVRMMQRDIIRVVDAVCPENGSGAANVKVVRKVLQGLQTKLILLEQTVVEIEGCLKERDTSANDFSLSSPVDGNEQTGPPASATDPDVSGPQPTQRNGASIKPTRRQIEQRIEEDRERHKRMRESMWVVPSNPIEQARKFFAETSDLGEDDRVLGKEEITGFRIRVQDAACGHKSRGMREERPKPRTTNGVARHI